MFVGIMSSKLILINHNLSTNVTCEFSMSQNLVSIQCIICSIFLVTLIAFEIETFFMFCSNMFLIARHPLEGFITMWTISYTRSIILLWRFFPMGFSFVSSKFFVSLKKSWTLVTHERFFRSILLQFWVQNFWMLELVMGKPSNSWDKIPATLITKQFFFIFLWIALSVVSIFNVFLIFLAVMKCFVTSFTCELFFDVSWRSTEKE